MFSVLGRLPFDIRACFYIEDTNTVHIPRNCASNYKLEVLAA
jgi:hypothetical protein